MTSSYPLHSPDFHAGDPYPAYRALRAESPVHWNDEHGFWGVTRYEDVRYVSSHPDLFSSEGGIIIPEPGKDMTQPGSLIFTDPPRHRQLRKLISSGFTPRHVTALAPKVDALVDEILAPIGRGDSLEFAETLAAPLPTRIIAELIGAPASDWEQFRVWSDAAVGALDPDIETDPTVALLELHEYFSALIVERRADPRAGDDADIISQLLVAEVDGERLTDEDLYLFCWLLLIAGNETTRNLIALGTIALIEHPDQRQLLIDDPSLIPTAVEEMLRFTTPVTHMARTATSDVTIRDQDIAKDDVVVMLYGSANRDEAVFGDDAEEFKVTRDPNPHLAFGFGEHLCLGAALARLEARVFFEKLLAKFPTVALDGEVARMRATMVPGVKRMPVTM